MRAATPKKPARATATPRRAVTVGDAAPRVEILSSSPTGDAATASRSVSDAAQGSNVREAFRLMATLIYPSIPLGYLDLCARILQRRHMETVFEERSVQLLCAFPPCANKLKDKNAKYRVSLKKKEIYDAHTENQFCSEQCIKKARVYVSRLVVKPPQLVPSLIDVFGSEKPNPFQWEKEQQALQAAVKESGANRRRAPQAKTVWSKTGDLGIVERPNPTDPVQLLASLAASAPAITENAEPVAPTNEFPDATQAVLIEGFVFPSHKQSLAKKVERKWQETAKSRGDEIVVSDSEESDIGDDSADDDDDDASSTSSLDASEYDPDDIEGEVISTDDLPLFINMWRMFSSWITHDTTLLVANRPLSAKTALPPPKDAQEKKEREHADRVAQMVFNERYNAFSLLLGRPLPHVAQQLKLSCDRYATHRIDSLIKSFVFREAIDGSKSDQWTCIAALLLLVAHDKQVSSIAPELLSSAQQITKLDAHEIGQLLALFYTLRDESEIVVDEDVAVRTTEEESEAKKRAAAYDAAKKCRRCRRPEAKCVCSDRAKPQQEDKLTAEKEDFSTAEIEQMFRDAVTLREHYEDLVEAAGGDYDDVD